MALIHNSRGPLHQRRRSSSEIIYGIEDFPVVKPLGEGSYSSVYLATHKRITNLSNQPEELVVVKKVNKAKSQVHFLNSEKEAGRRLHHPNIAEVRANFEDSENSFFVMNYVNGIDMYKFFEQRAFTPFTESRGRKLFKQLVEALNYAQKRNVSHRDLKLGNVQKTLPLLTINRKYYDFKCR
jgi:serine/threonine protein kinase